MAGELERYRAARDAFEKYAAMGAGELPDDPWSALQVRLFRWQEKNFGHRPSKNHSELGIAEELGEAYNETAEIMERLMEPWSEAILNLRLGGSVGKVLHTVLKHEQKIRGMEDIEIARANLADGGADMMVFLMQLFTKYRIDFSTLFRLTIEYVLERDWTKANKENGDAA